MNQSEIYLKILYYGLLDIRANSNDPKQVFAQSDHLHNIPDLIANPDATDRHDYYWDCERDCYLRQCNPDHATMFDALWAQLSDLRANSDRNAST